MSLAAIATMDNLAFYRCAINAPVGAGVETHPAAQTVLCVLSVASRHTQIGLELWISGSGSAREGAYSSSGSGSSKSSGLGSSNLRAFGSTSIRRDAG